MQYRTIKRCNDLKVSEIALGCEGLAGKSTEELKAMIDRALELGIGEQISESGPGSERGAGNCS